VYFVANSIAFGMLLSLQENLQMQNPSVNNSRPEVLIFIERSILDNVALLSRSPNKTTMNFYTAHAILAKAILNAEVYTGQGSLGGMPKRWQDVVIFRTIIPR